MGGILVLKKITKFNPVVEFEFFLNPSFENVLSPTRVCVQYDGPVHILTFGTVFDPVCNMIDPYTWILATF